MPARYSENSCGMPLKDCSNRAAQNVAHGFVRMTHTCTRWRCQRAPRSIVAGHRACSRASTGTRTTFSQVVCPDILAGNLEPENFESMSISNANYRRDSKLAGQRQGRATRATGNRGYITYCHRVVTAQWWPGDCQLPARSII